MRFSVFRSAEAESGSRLGPAVNAEAGPSRLASTGPASSIPPPPPPPPPVSSLLAGGESIPAPTLGGRGARLPPPVRPDKRYVGPDPASLEPPRTKSQAEKFFATLANEPVKPSRFSKALSIGSWVAGTAACVYMTLYADFGNREHVFSPLRRHFHRLTQDMFTLSPSERKMLDLDRPFRSDEVVADKLVDRHTPSGRAV